MQAARTFEWDVRNRLVALSRGTERTKYSYDSRDRRVVAVRATTHHLIYGDIYVPKRVTRSPAVDTTVKDPLTAWIHESAYHINPAIQKAREEAAKYEKAYRTKDECDGACKKARPAVENAFRRELENSQAREDARR